MSEKLNVHETEVEVPELLDEQWVSEFNEQYGDKGFQASVTTEGWLEQPENEIGSEYYTHEDEWSDGNWWQTITGKIYDIGYTNIPHSPNGSAHVLALEQAEVRYPDGSGRELAEGRLVLIRLDRIKNSITIKPLDEER